LTAVPEKSKEETKKTTAKADALVEWGLLPQVPARICFVLRSRVFRRAEDLSYNLEACATSRCLFL
jgi:hypothetical protein